LALVVLPARSMAAMSMVLMPAARFAVALKLVPFMAADWALPLLTLMVTVEFSLTEPLTVTNDWAEVLLSAGFDTVSTGAARS